MRAQRAWARAAGSSPSGGRRGRVWTAPSTAGRRTPLVLLSAVLGLWTLAPSVTPAAARTIAWSGYTWTVRSETGLSGPGPNYWSDSTSNVTVNADGELVLSVVRDGRGRWTSAEVDNARHLGYGTYRWVVNSDLSALDANDVLGMFTYGGAAPSNNEIDIEPARWGNPAALTGSATVWQDAGRGFNQSRTFAYSAYPPYVNEFTWEPGRVTFHITDAHGIELLHWVVTSGVPTPSTEIPIINFWRFDGSAPAGTRSVRLQSFAWTALVSPPTTLAPVNTTAPSLSGTPRVGQTLTAQRGSWTGSPTSYRYAWQRCAGDGSACADIARATGASYALSSADLGRTIRVRVTAANGAGSTSAVSAASAPVTAQVCQRRCR